MAYVDASPAQQATGLLSGYRSSLSADSISLKPVETNEDTVHPSSTESAFSARLVVEKQQGTQEWRKTQRGAGVQRTVSVGKGQEKPNGKGTDGVGRREPDLVEG
eukprot:3419753-Pleurochrysis_carterae.AAC.1